jgi:hypothetical protein
MTFKRSALVGLVALASWIMPAKAGDRPFDWDRYHARQAACAEADRIAQDCTKGVAFCDGDLPMVSVVLRSSARAASGQTRVLGLRAAGGASVMTLDLSDEEEGTHPAQRKAIPNP